MSIKRICETHQCLTEEVESVEGFKNGIVMQTCSPKCPQHTTDPQEQQR